MTRVIPITKDVARRVVEKKHYRKTLGVFWHGFGLIHDDSLVGVVTFGQPSAPIQKHAFRDRDFPLLELTRLVVDDGVVNGASFLIGNAIKQLRKPCVLISYADTSHGHCGVVYQATNWLYTGAVVAHDKFYKVNGDLLHPMTVRDRFGVTNPAAWAKENGIEAVAPMPKHRFFYFMGSKSQRKRMVSKLSYDIVAEYPKADKSMYDSVGCCEDFASYKQFAASMDSGESWFGGEFQ